LATQIIGAASEATGFATTSTLFFTLDGPIRIEDLPDVHGSVAPDSPIVLVSIDETAPDFLRRYPMTTRFFEDAGPFGAPNLLALLPLQGIVLRPKTKYAVVVTNSLHDKNGARIGAGPSMQKLLDGKQPEGMSAEVFSAHEQALVQLAQAGMTRTELAGLSVFTTGSPTDDYERVASAMQKLPLPMVTTPFVRKEVFDDYCVYESTIPMPVYQGGIPPYTAEGGAFVFDAAAEPVLQRMEEANFVVTIPRRVMPIAGYPMVVLSRTGAGGERPLVDRGPRAENGGAAITPGTGPALSFAKAGFAGASIDGPHGGRRNVSKSDEQFLVFNIGNPVALRDNIRQSAAELALEAHVLETLSIDVTDCPSATTPDGKARFDVNTMGLMGHSMGASIVPITAAFEPRYRALLLSGAGGSFITNVVYKQKPLATRTLAEALLGIAGSEYSLNEFDPLLAMLQWAGEPADVPPYAVRFIRESKGGPRHALMMQGIVDHYILPPIANPMSLSLGLDLAGDSLDETNAELSTFTPLGKLLDLGGAKRMTLPASGNVDQMGVLATAVVVQHPEDGIEDGHEVVFQTDAPKRQIRCFLESFAQGIPKVPAAGGVSDPCE
jgi:hypothetical protein